MSKLRFSISVSLDGYVAGPDQSEEYGLGVGGEALHDWVVELEAWRKSHGKEGGKTNESTVVMEEMIDNVGASIMGRNMFGPVRGPWDPDNPWNGWWGDDPPFPGQVFVLTHHPREPLILSDTTFNFVTDGIEAALERAREAAGGKDVAIGGGAQTLNEYLAAGLVDEMQLSVVPSLLGDGARLFEGVDAGLNLELVRTIDAPGVTHLKYHVSN
jgi:dihydrofolate reductase